MMEFVLSLITDKTKPHPEMHCDLNEGDPPEYMILPKGKKCANMFCPKAYHHDCAEISLGTPCWVCECEKCGEHKQGLYSFYAPKKYFKRRLDQQLVCPWCLENCK